MCMVLICHITIHVCEFHCNESCSPFTNLTQLWDEAGLARATRCVLETVKIFQANTVMCKLAIGFTIARLMRWQHNADNFGKIS